MNRSNSKTIPFYISVFSSLFAAIVHGILTKKHFQIRYGESEAGGICNINDYFSCDAASNSSFSEFLGAPLAIFGLIFNLLFLAVVLFWYFKNESEDSASAHLGKKLSTLIFGASVVMSVISLTFVKSICPYCLGAYVLSIFTFWGSYKLWGKFIDGQWADLKHLKNFALVLIGVVIAAKLVDTQIEGQYVTAQDLELHDLVVKDWKSRPDTKIDLISPTELNPTSQVMHIVEFADFLCGHCKEAYPKLHSFAESRGVRLSFQSFPLDGECNKSVEQAVGSRCLLAKIAYCSENISQKGWQAQAWIFERQTKLISKESIESQLPDFSTNTGIDLALLKDCINKEETLDVIKKQAELGTQLGVEGTPAIFINGKKIRAGVSVPLLESIYREIKSN